MVKNPIDATSEAMKNFNDGGFSQYLSPKVIRDFNHVLCLMEIVFSKLYVVSSVSDENGYNEKALATQYERNYSIPNIEVNLELIYLMIEN